LTTGVPPKLQMTDRPRTTARNTLRRKRRPKLSVGRAIPVMVLIAVCTELMLAYRSAGALMSIGMVGGLSAACLTPGVDRSRRRPGSRRGTYLFAAWLVLALGFSLSFFSSGLGHARTGRSALSRAGVELKRTLLAAGLYGACAVGVWKIRRS
jgi:hypothetical protein